MIEAADCGDLFFYRRTPPETNPHLNAHDISPILKADSGYGGIALVG